MKELNSLERLLKSADRRRGDFERANMENWGTLRQTMRCWNIRVAGLFSGPISCDRQAPVWGNSPQKVEIRIGAGHDGLPVGCASNFLSTCHFDI